ncbi:hypothetical protein [Streptomyces sp. NBC_00388]|uniref:hypothetical protein n=1 Tax=Streptomyces sp. NBC_00388 TaxID=2975735 RepID=UPI002E221D19
MPTEIALLESRALRADHLGRVDVLDKVEALQLLPDGLHVTTEGVATYFSVQKGAVHSLVRRHRAELESNGLVTLKGHDLRVFEVSNLTTSSSSHAESYPQGRAHLRLFSRRTVLNIAMLLRDSEVARRVRNHLLDTEEQHRARAADAPGHEGLDRRVTRLESAMSDVRALRDLAPALRELGPALRDLGPLLVRMSDRVEALDQRLAATNRVVGAMSVRLSDAHEDLIEVKRRLPHLAYQAEQERRRRRRHRR